jgi:hypothetical protein
LASDDDFLVFGKMGFNDGHKLLIQHHALRRIVKGYRDVHGTGRMAGRELADRSHVDIDASRIVLQNVMRFLGVNILNSHSKLLGLQYSAHHRLIQL